MANISYYLFVEMYNLFDSNYVAHNRVTQRWT